MLKKYLCIGLLILTLMVPSGAAEAGSRFSGDVLSDAWMGVYIDGVKIGYIHNREERIHRDGEEIFLNRSESVMKVSRLGGEPIEIRSTQESFFDASNNPLETGLITRMSESETVIRARVTPQEIVFSMGEEVVKRVPHPGEFVLGVPYEEIIASGRLTPGYSHVYRMLDPMSYDFSDCRFEVIGEEDIRVRGLPLRLWHVRSEVSTLIPVTVDEWIDEEGVVFRSDTQAGFLNTTALRMPRDMALEESGDNLDIAFSSVITSNVRIEDPLPVRRMVIELGGVDPDRLRGLPGDQDSQRIVSFADGMLKIETRAKIMRERDSVRRPVSDEALRSALEATAFCQSDDPEIAALSESIVGGERNAWRAAKRIAEWIATELTPNYDVGFASAREILRNREGDCSEHTVLFVALCRAAGIPARAAIGVMSGGGIFAYHMWPEVWVGAWIDLDAKWLARDEETGEYYTDATHIKLGRSLLDENLFQEMATAVSELIGRLTIRILDYQTR